MGCGASKNDVINSSKNSVSDEGTKTKNKDNSNGVIKVGSDDNSNGGQTKTSSQSSVVSESSTIPANEAFMSNGNRVRSSSALKPLPTLPPLKPPRTSKVGFVDQNTNESTEMDQNPHRTVPVAFEVPAADNDEGSLIKRHPPRRLRQWEDNPSDTSALTQESLEEKVQQANQRRAQMLHQRVASARQKSARAPRVKKPMMSASEFVSEIESAEKEEAMLVSNGGY